VSRPAPCLRPDVAELLGSYVVGACSNEEAAGVRRHLARCASCRAALAGLAPAREGLLAQVPPAAPPEHLKTSVMRQVRADAALFDAARAPVRAPRRRRVPPRVLALGVAALAAVAVAVMVAAGTLLGGTDRETVYVGRVDGVAAPGGRASIAVRGGEARLRVSGFPAAGPGRLYEVWMSDGTGMRPAHARFSVDTRGAGEVQMAELPPAGQQVMVTSEVAGSATRPTRAPILRVTLGS
jgi:anti-sigma-K factor RskA